MWVSEKLFWRISRGSVRRAGGTLGLVAGLSQHLLTYQLAVSCLLRLKSVVERCRRYWPMLIGRRKMWFYMGIRK